MTQRTRHALQAAGIFCAAGLAFYVFVNLAMGAMPTLLHWVLWPALVSLFATAFLVWWLMFRRLGGRILPAALAGFLIANLWPLPLAVATFMAGLGTPNLLNLETWTPAFLARAVFFSIPYILLALLIRWRQVKENAAHNHSGQDKS